MATVTPEQMKKALSSLSALEGMASGYCELQDGFDTSKGIAENVRQVLAALAATPAEARTFPIQSERAAKPHPTRIPWWLADLAYSVYRARFGSGQSLERLAERGGFHPSEMDEYVPDWRELAAQAPPASDPPGLVANWRPIETAPKRTDVLAGWADRPHWLPQVLQQDDAGMWFNGEESDYRPPTHWMPLPASPQAKED